MVSVQSHRRRGSHREFLNHSLASIVAWLAQKARGWPIKCPMLLARAEAQQAW